MCGRYQFSIGNSGELQQILRVAARRCGQEASAVAAGDVMPSRAAPVLVARGGKIVAEVQKWGWRSAHGGVLINARAETVCERPLFRERMLMGRCVVPTSGFYEWDAAKHRYFFGEPDQPVYLAGIDDCIDGTDCFVILTTAPNESVRAVHDRMPLVLQRAQIRPWLTDAQQALALLRTRPPELTRTATDGQMTLGEL